VMCEPLPVIGSKNESGRYFVNQDLFDVCSGRKCHKVDY
jgi:hypothetical protein